MKKNIFAWCLMVAMAFSATAVLNAEPVDMNAGSIHLRGDQEKSSIAESRDIDGDYIWGGSEIDFTGASDDVYLVGRDIGFSGSSRGSLTAFGSSVTIAGLVGNNLHSAGLDVRISGTIKDTAFVAGREITVADEAVVEGTLISVSGSLHIMGELQDGLLGGAGEIIIDGPVKGDVNIRTARLSITERGSIEGNLTYSSNSLLSADELSRVSGAVTFKENKKIDKDAFSAFRFIAGLLFFLALLATGMLLLLLPVLKEAVAEDRDLKSYGKTALWGLLPLFVYPVLVVVSILLLPLSIALALAAFPLAFLNMVLGLALTGRVLFKVFGWKKENRFLYFLLAFGIFIPLSLVPYLGGLVTLAVMALGAGQMVRMVFKTRW